MENYMIGVFNVESDKLAVTDPCYGNASCVLDNVANGTWLASVKVVPVEFFGNAMCVGQLEAHLDKVDVNDLAFKYAAHVGVDSGQMGIFDAPHYGHAFNYEAHGADEYNDDFYNQCCEKTFKHKAGIIGNYGCVSRSGLGDGGYDVLVAKNSFNKIVGVKVLFLEEEAN